MRSKLSKELALAESIGLLPNINQLITIRLNSAFLRLKDDAMLLLANKLLEINEKITKINAEILRHS